MKASSEKRLIVLVGCILALSCGEDGAAPKPAAILDIIDPSTTTDTIDAVTALTVEVRGGELPVRVRVDLGVRVGGRPHMIVPTHSIASQVLLWTDDTGRLTIPLAYGRDAGQVVVSAFLAEDEGARDTVRFEILPGEPVLARAQPGDTLLAVGEEFDIAGTTVDRYGNVRDDDATSVSSDTSVVAVAGSGSHLRLSAAGEGIARVYLQVTTVLGTLGDTTTVAVVPPETRLASGGLGFPLMASDPLGRDRRYADITLPNPAWDPQNPERVIGRSSRFASTTVRSYEFDIGRLTEVPVPAGLTAPSVPSFSPDGTYIYFHAEYSWNQRRIYRMSRDGTALLALTDEPNAEGASVSPDGRLLAYTASGLWVRDLETGAKRRIDAAFRAMLPKFSPDGHWIAYSRDYFLAPLAIIRPDGTDSREFTMTYPGVSWSPSGRLIVALGDSALTLVDVKSALTFRLPIVGEQPAWRH